MGNARAAKPQGKRPGLEKPHKLQRRADSEISEILEEEKTTKLRRVQLPAL